MIRLPVAVLCLAGAALADEVEDAGRLFAARCASCHTLPDKALKGDRAWIGQVERTA